MTSPQISRRQFTSAIAATGLCAATGTSALANIKLKKKLELGIDNFAVRAMKWKAEELIDYAARMKVDSMFITDLYAFRSLEDKALKELKKKADDANVNLYVGTWSICPTSPRFKDEWGTAEEHLALGVRVAKALGAPSIRVVLGGRDDRKTDGGIEARIDDTVKVLKAVKSRAMDAGIQVAMENHAGDMHSLELIHLIEEAGKELVGVNLDSGNAVWTMEDPLVNLQTLGPYTLTTSLRDTAVWESDNGITAQWTAMGEGMVDWEKYFALFAKICPNAPVNIETISGFNHEIAFKNEDYMKAWPKGKPQGFDKFAAWAKGGKPRAAHQHPKNVDRAKATQEYQLGDIERSIAYCKKIGLGRG
jgi:sugar phosphate isomerase/epimerase